jgi:hypothetical protein
MNSPPGGRVSPTQHRMCWAEGAATRVPRYAEDSRKDRIRLTQLQPMAVLVEPSEQPASSRRLQPFAQSGTPTSWCSGHRYLVSQSRAVFLHLTTLARSNELHTVMLARPRWRWRAAKSGNCLSVFFRASRTRSTAARPIVRQAMPPNMSRHAAALRLSAKLRTTTNSFHGLAPHM